MVEKGTEMDTSQCLDNNKGVLLVYVKRLEGRIVP